MKLLYFYHNAGKNNTVSFINCFTSIFTDGSYFYSSTELFIIENIKNYIYLSPFAVCPKRLHLIYIYLTNLLRTYHVLNTEVVFMHGNLENMNKSALKEIQPKLS